MERSGEHRPNAATVVIRATLVSEETGSLFHPRRGVHLSLYGTAVLAACRTAAAVLWCCRCCSILLLNIHAHMSCALCGVAAASSCDTTCVCCMIRLRLLPFVVVLPLHAVVEFTRT